MLLHKQLLAFRPSKMDFIFALKSFLAAMLALYVAFSLDLAYPMWAIGTVFIIVNPYSGMVSSKAVYRLFGTMVGAVVAILLTPKLIDTPIIFSAVVALWVGFCLYISLLDRTPRSYVFMLAGYTTAMIVCNAVNNIDTISVFDMALGRVLEISVAVVCTAVVFSVVMPQHLGSAIQQRVSRALTDTREIFQEILTNPQHDKNYVHLLGIIARDIADIHALAVHLAYEKGELKGMTKPLQELLHQLSMVISNLTAMSERLAQLESMGASYREEFIQLHRQLNDFLQQQQDLQVQQLNILPAALDANFSQIKQHATAQQAIILDSLQMDIRHLIQNVTTVKFLWQLIQKGDKNIPTEIAPLTTTYPSLHRDHGMALRSSIAAVVAIMVAFLLWIYSGWRAGYMMAQLTAVSVCILTALDNPVPALKLFIRGSLYASLLVIIYAFGIMPEVKEFWQLALVLAPCLIYVVMLYPHPPLNGLALPTMVSFIMSLNLQNHYRTDAVMLFDACLGSVLGPTIAALSLYFIRAISPEESASRLLAAHYKAMREALYLPYGAGFRVHLRSMLDRVGVLNSKMVQSYQLKNAMNLALIETSAVVDLVRLNELAGRPQTSQNLKQQLSVFLDRLDDIFREQEKKRALPQALEKELLLHIQHLSAIAQTEADPEIAERVMMSLNNIQSSVLHQPFTLGETSITSQSAGA
ncbi:FUSC family protein [Acinetobacter sp. MD2(2019)]|uniref:FUSC family protein n=1 Tax=Acinetobacter sp. MD2(2019) TaxID=2605273 RepID=UPI002D1F79DE|nr:FUSC family protein [Acinetobacter sp. MD2(2019)]MEB3754324.1 FUSC family protein [Acinetobacter sp. MD2(2019)]